MADTPPPGSTTRASRVVLVPILFIGALAVSFVTLVYSVGQVDTAAGAQVQIGWAPTCGDDSIFPTLEARARAMGLPLTDVEIATGKISARVILPAAEGNSRRIPKVLVQTGELLITDESGASLATNEHLNSTGVEIDLAGMPTTMLRFNAVAIKAMSDALLGGTAPIRVAVDGVEVAQFSDLPDLDEGYIELPSGEGHTRKRMLVAADRAIVLADGPLPCTVRVERVVPATEAG